MKVLLIIWGLLCTQMLYGQQLKIKQRKADALSGSRFAASVSDTAIRLKQREKLIYRQVRQGNIPAFYRRMVEVSDTATINNVPTTVTYYVLPDYLAIGTDSDYFYCPMTPALAQRVANKLKCSLPTRKMVDMIYRHATVKLAPRPIPPSVEMTTVNVFLKHNAPIKRQRDSVLEIYPPGSLVAGNKKDIIISNKIYNDTSAYHVVIYGWHKLNGLPIQPVYAKHLNTWADYSHGVRLVQDKIWVNGKKTSIKKVLRSGKLNALLSDEGQIKKPRYPTHRQ